MNTNYLLSKSNVTKSVLRQKSSLNVPTFGAALRSTRGTPQRGLP